MEVSKSIFKRQADFLEKNGKYLLQFTCQVNMKMSQIFPNISTDFHGAFAFLNVYQKTVVSRDE